jgi:hypothetical protein
MMTETYDAVRACALAVCAGRIVKANGVTAGRGIVVDWREVRSGEHVLADADAFDVAQTFVALVGVEGARAAVDGVEDAEPIALPPPEITAWRPNEHGQRARSFEVGRFKVTVESKAYGEDDEGEAAAFTERLAALAAEVGS